MVGRQQLINKLRELGYSFKRSAKHVEFWKRKGSTHRVAIPKQRKQIEDAEVRSILLQCGCSLPEIEDFLRSAKS